MVEHANAPKHVNRSSGWRPASIPPSVRWPNGTLSIVSAEDEQSIIKQLTKDDVGNVEENDSPHGMVIDVPAGFTIHLDLTDDADFEFRGFAADSMPTFERFYPHIAAVMKVGYKTKKAVMAAAKEAVEKERQGLKR